MLPGLPSSRFHTRRKETVQRREQSPAAAQGLQRQLRSCSRDLELPAEGKGCTAEACCPNRPSRRQVPRSQHGAAGQDGPFSLGSWWRLDQRSCVCWTGRKEGEEQQLSAKGVRGVPASGRWFVCAAGVPVIPRRGWEEEEDGWEEGEEHQATWLQFELLSPLHNFWIFSAITMGFSLRIFSAASAL